MNVPDEINGYHLVGPLGHGGMGLVYTALSPGEELVAVKLMAGEHAADCQRRARFVREAATLAQFSHPGVVRILSYGVLPDQTLYLIMELLPGLSLRAVLAERGRLPVNHVVAIGQQVSAALSAVHAREVIHRDIKPENLMLLAPDSTAGPLVKVIDFGLAKASVTEGASGTEIVTSSGAMLGTAPYMPWEQLAEPGAVTAAVDVYALGLVLCELLEGSLPFDRSNAYAAWQWHHDALAPLPVSAGRGLPAWLQALLRRMLDRDPAQRPNMATVRDRLHEQERLPPLRQRPAPGVRRLRLAALLAGGALIALVGSAARRLWLREQAWQQAQVDWLRLVNDTDHESARQPGMSAARRHALSSALQQVQHSSSPLLTVERARTYHRFGELAMNHGATAEARQWQDLAVGALPHAGALLKAQIFYWEGGQAKQEGRLEVAAQAYQRSLQALGPYPRDDAALRACAIAQEGLGQVYLHQGHVAEALAAYHQAEVCEARRAGPREGLRRFVASYHQFRLAEATQEQGAFGEAERLLGEAQRLGAPLRAHASAVFQVHLARCALMRAKLRLGQGDRAGAARAAEEGWHFARTALALEPAAPQELALAESEEAVALTLEAQGQRGAELRERALARRQAVLRADPQNGLAAHDLALVLKERIEHRRDPGDSSSALAGLLRTLDSTDLGRDDAHLASLRERLTRSPAL